MSTILNFGKDVQGYNAYAPMPATDLFSVTLESAANTSFTVPSNYVNWIVVFSYQGAPDVWVAYGATGILATTPVGGTFLSTNSELNPGSRSVKGGTVINIKNNSTVSTDVGVSLYAIS
jgi:hypothetical protein